MARAGPLWKFLFKCFTNNFLCFLLNFFISTMIQGLIFLSYNVSTDSYVILWLVLRVSWKIPRTIWLGFKVYFLVYPVFIGTIKPPFFMYLLPWAGRSILCKQYFGIIIFFFYVVNKSLSVCLISSSIRSLSDLCISLNSILSLPKYLVSHPFFTFCVTTILLINMFGGVFWLIKECIYFYSKFT